MPGSHGLLTSKAPGRNDPCPCGSGRKYKQCCAVQPKAGNPAPPGFGPLTPAGLFAGAPAADVKPLAKAAAPRAGQPALSPAAARADQQARRLVEAGRADAAIPLLEQAIRLDPASPG